MDKSNYFVIVLIILMGVAVFFVVKGDKSPEDAVQPRNSQNQDSTSNQNSDGNAGTSQKNVVLAPEISGVTPDGTKINIADFKGKVVVIDFWAAWCGPCRQFIPTLANLYSKYKDRGVEIVGVYVDGKDTNLANLKSIKKQFGSNWPQIVGQGAFESAQRYNVRGIPHIALIGKDGSLVMQNVQNRYNIEEYVLKELNK